MTNKEAIKHLRTIADLMPIDKCSDWIEACDMAIDALKSSMWTSCSERPPEENEFYLATIHVHEMNSDFCEKLFYGTPEYPNTNEVGWYFLNGDETTVKVNGVTAWMPLPEPWEGDIDGTV